MNGEEALALMGALEVYRPDWSRFQIRNTINHVKVMSQPYTTACIAATIIATRKDENDNYVAYSPAMLLTDTDCWVIARGHGKGISRPQPARYEELCVFCGSGPHDPTIVCDRYTPRPTPAPEPERVHASAAQTKEALHQAMRTARERTPDPAPEESELDVPVLA